MPSCSLLYSQQRFDEFVVCAKHVLFNMCRDLSEKSVLRGNYHVITVSDGKTIVFCFAILSLLLYLYSVH